MLFCGGGDGIMPTRPPGKNGYLYKILLFILLGHQSVRDGTAQAGTPILKFTSIYTNKDWIDGTFKSELFPFFIFFSFPIFIGLMGLAGQWHT